MVSMLDSGLSGSGLTPGPLGQDHCVVFSGKTLYSHSSQANRLTSQGVEILLAGMLWEPEENASL